MMLIIVATATRMKTGAAWATLILVSANVPAFLTMLTRDLGLEYFEWLNYPRVFLNLLWFPALWIFTQSQFDKSFRFSTHHLWHIVPALISLSATILFYVPLTAEQVEIERAAWAAGNENLPTLINDVFGFLQFFGYFTAIFFYVRKQRKYLRNNYSDSVLVNTRWIIRFLVVFFVLYLMALLVYAIFPSTDSWCCPLVVVLIMAYLVYVVIYQSTAQYLSRLPDIPENNTPLPTTVVAQMKDICDIVIQYLQTTGAYKNCGLTLADLSNGTGINKGRISAAINTHLKQNFFEVVNVMRIEEAKQQLQQLDTNRTIESIASECGFSSRSTFFATFKAIEGTSPQQWLRSGER
jgi:AraC-like DNA-binding protein